uniref:Uncharacterized protein n=1 Tax=viral metagenome TaxID=1070528 RepID=A0A6C0D0Y8_9ZZZZ
MNPLPILKPQRTQLTDIGRYFPKNIHIFVFYFCLFLIILYALLYRLKVVKISTDAPVWVITLFELFNLFVLSIGVIFVWKGLYSLIDIHFLINNPFIGNVLAFLIGFTILFLIGGQQAIYQYFG